jgi:hypothetical protein
MRKTALALLVLALGLATAAAPAAAAVDDAGLLEVGPDYNGGKAIAVSGIDQGAPPGVVEASGAEVQSAGVPPESGDVRLWLALDDVNGFLYAKEFTLRGLGDRVEVWVASGEDEISSGLAFPAGDCRNGPLTAISDAQVAQLVAEFDGTIFPLESRVFSTPPARDGSGQLLPPELFDSGGVGESLVVLVDNVRDANFYDTDNANTYSYIAGFFFSFLTELHDRNVVTVDAWDWLHRTGSAPPDEPSADPCTSAPARPFLYEGVFAHEYQHLLQYYEDPDEEAWLNEGLSDWAQSLTGYVDPSEPITSPRFDSHVQCMLGFIGVATPANPIPGRGGPENSLTLWGDQVAQDEGEILCDYGAAYTFMEFLHGRYGERIMKYLHQSDTNGLFSVQQALDAVRSGTFPGQFAQDVLHDWAAMLALDGVLETGTPLWGGSSRNYRAPGLSAMVNWETGDAYDSPGAPPNGSDYVRLRGADGRFLSAGEIESISFDGASALQPAPVEWEVAPDAPGNEGGAALASGAGDGLDRAIVLSVDVPPAPATLTFRTLWDTEPFFDYGFVQVSTDGGRSYRSLGNADTTSEADPSAIPAVAANLPGFNGRSGLPPECTPFDPPDVCPAAWVTESFDLSAYAGQTVLLAFRYVTDSSVVLPGWWIDDVAINGELVSDGTTLEGWRSPTEIVPIEVAGWTVQIVAYTNDLRVARLGRLALDGSFARRIVRGPDGALTRMLGRRPEVVAAIVTYDEPSGLVSQYAPYRLEVNGVLQPGGGEPAAPPGDF